MAQGRTLRDVRRVDCVGMTPFDELGTLALGLAVPAAGFFACALVVRAVARRRGELPRAAEALAAQLDLPLAPLDAAEVAGLVGEGILPAQGRASPAVHWVAEDATFAALVVMRREGPVGVVIVTPRGTVGEKPRLAGLARRTPRDLLSLALPGDLPTTSPDVVATRIGGRLVVRRPGVRTAEELERLIMCACAILDSASSTIL